MKTALLGLTQTGQDGPRAGHALVVLRRLFVTSSACIAYLFNVKICPILNLLILNQFWFDLNHGSNFDVRTYELCSIKTTVLVILHVYVLLQRSNITSTIMHLLSRSGAMLPSLRLIPFFLECTISFKYLFFVNESILMLCSWFFLSTIDIWIWTLFIPHAMRILLHVYVR